MDKMRWHCAAWVGGVIILALCAAGCRTPPLAPAFPADAVEFQGHRYKVFEEAGSWRQAKKRCEEMGGYLSCVETAAEQEFICELADGRYLSLGASDEAREDAWCWVNGASFNYACWADGQPNNYGGGEDFLATYDGGDWVDVADEGDGFWMPTGFICEWDQ